MGRLKGHILSLLSKFDASSGPRAPEPFTQEARASEPLSLQPVVRLERLEFAPPPPVAVPKPVAPKPRQPERHSTGGKQPRSWAQRPQPADDSDTTETVA